MTFSWRVFAAIAAVRIYAPAKKFRHMRRARENSSGERRRRRFWIAADCVPFMTDGFAGFRREKVTLRIFAYIAVAGSGFTLILIL